MICTQPHPRIYLLTFTSPPDNRLTPSFCRTFLLALDILEHRYPTGAVVTTSGISKFYSNGLDYESAVKTEGFFQDAEGVVGVWRRLLTYPMPTIALINGHAFAAGLMLAMFHDYRVMNPHRGFLCLNELDFGAPLRPAMASIFRIKLPSPHTLRTLILEAHRFTPPQALTEGFVDGLGGIDEVFSLIDEGRLVDRGKSGVYGRLKEEMWREGVGMLDAEMDGGSGEDGTQEGEKEERERRRQEERKRRVEEWERGVGRRGAKL